MKRIVLWAAALLPLISGCVYVDYIGQTFAPIPEGSPVTYFEGRSDIPAGKYRIIGRGEIFTTRSLDKYDIREILVDEARKRGSDAVVLVELKSVIRGVYERDTSDPGYDTAPATKSSNVKADGEPLYVPMNSTAVNVRGEAHSRRELKMRVLFLKTKEDLEQELARRGRELDRLVKQPDPANAKPAEKPEKAEKR